MTNCISWHSTSAGQCNNQKYTGLFEADSSPTKYTNNTKLKNKLPAAASLRPIVYQQQQRAALTGRHPERKVLIGQVLRLPNF